MKSFVAILALVAVAAADVSHLGNSEASAVTTNQEADVRPDGYQQKFETSNGIQVAEEGQLKGNGKDEAAIEVQGSNAYTSPEGKRILTRYVADAFGYHPEGEHLPTPPAPEPIPEYIQRSLDYIKAHPYKSEYEPRT